MKKYQMGEVPQRLSEELLDKLSAIEVATIGHFRHRGFVNKRLQPISPVKKTIIGTAVTIAIPATDSTLLHHSISVLRKGDFLIVDRLGDDRHACIGGGVALAIKTAGVVGVAIDGPCTDPDEIIDLDLPLWSSGISGITTRLNDLGGSLNLPVSCGNVPVIAGDVVIADASGIVIIPRNEIEEVMEEALARQARAGRFQTRIFEGENLGDLSGATQMIKKALED